MRLSQSVIDRQRLLRCRLSLAKKFAVACESQFPTQRYSAKRAGDGQPGVCLGEQRILANGLLEVGDAPVEIGRGEFREEISGSQLQLMRSRVHAVVRCEALPLF